MAEGVVFQETGILHLPFLEQGLTKNVAQQAFVFLIVPSGVVRNAIMSAEEI